jgi:hypothetical protein
VGFVEPDALDKNIVGIAETYRAGHGVKSRSRAGIGQLEIGYIEPCTDSGEIVVA